MSSAKDNQDSEQQNQGKNKAEGAANPAQEGEQHEKTRGASGSGAAAKAGEAQSSQRETTGAAAQNMKSKVPLAALKTEAQGSSASKAAEAPEGAA